MPAGAALVLGESLFFLALGAAAIHLAMTQVVLEEEPAAGTVFGSRLGDLRFATGEWALKDSLTV